MCPLNCQHQQSNSNKQRWISRIHRRHDGGTRRHLVRGIQLLRDSFRTGHQWSNIILVIVVKTLMGPSLMAFWTIGPSKHNWKTHITYNGMLLPRSSSSAPVDPPFKQPSFRTAAWHRSAQWIQVSQARKHVFAALNIGFITTHSDSRSWSYGSSCVYIYISYIIYPPKKKHVNYSY